MTRRRPITKTCTTPAHIELAAAWVNEMGKKGLADGPVRVELGRPSKSRMQEEKYHAMMKDIFPLVPERPPEVWKAFLVKWFDMEMEELGTPLRKPGKRVFDERYGEWMYIRPSTTGFTVKEAACFIEWLYAYGSERGVVWSKQAIEIYQEYREANNG